MTKQAPITHVATTDIADMLQPSPSGRRMPMDGFDEEFVDIADYIIRITDRIWHEKKIDLCLRYYSEDSAIHTLAGDIVGARTVEANTHATLKAFPDRTLDGDNVIWSGDDREGYYSSHLITSRMTNLGPSEFGPATGRRVRIRTIADCLCLRNKVIEEWLVRDNAALVLQLGFDLTQVAHAQAEEDLKQGRSIVANLAEMRDHSRRDAAKMDIGSAFPSPEREPAAFANAVFGSIWNRRRLDLLASAFDFRVGAHLTTGRDLYGTVEYREYLEQFFMAIPDLAVSVDHVADIPYLSAARDIAVRWILSGTHQGDGLFGPASGAPICIMGVSHWRVMNGRIREEWTVFDELAVRRQIETHRLRR
jgi:predicted ester cyclase